MKTGAISSTGIKRAQPLVKKLFRNANLYRPAPGKELIVQGTPQMVLCLPWLGVKEKVYLKFIKSWTDHGFSVMHIKTLLPDVVMPYTLSEVTVKRIVEYLLKSDHNVVLHGFCAGVYLGTRVVMEAQGTDLKPRITHQIFDSCTTVIGIPAGMKDSTSNPILSNIAGAIGWAYYNYCDLTMFQRSEEFLSNSPANIATYYMHSLADPIAKYHLIEHFIKAQSKISPTSVLLLPEAKNIGHVDLYRILGEKAYMSCIIKFLKRNNLNVRTDLEINDETKELATLETHLPQ